MLKRIDMNTPRSLPHVRNAIYSQPWAIQEQWLNAICEIFEASVNRENLEFEAVATPYRPDNGIKSPLLQMVDGVAVIPVRGPIFPRANLMTRLSGATSLDTLSAALDEAQSLDPRAIILDIDSPGGSVSGLKDFCNEILGTNSSHDTIAMITGTGASAAYMIASQCKSVMASEGSIVGSIGVVMRVDNDERADRNAGIDPIVIRSSELKAIGSGGPVTPAQQNELERMVDMYFSMFKSTVQSARPDLEMDKVATGQVWPGKSHNSEPSAKDMGLIDAVTTLKNLVSYHGVR
jgi:signal peptide peptidase SppA